MEKIDNFIKSLSKIRELDWAYVVYDSNKIQNPSKYISQLSGFNGQGTDARYFPENNVIKVAKKVSIDFIGRTNLVLHYKEGEELVALYLSYKNNSVGYDEGISKEVRKLIEKSGLMLNKNENNIMIPCG